MEATNAGNRNGVNVELLNHYIAGMSGPEPWLSTARTRHRWIGAFAVEGRAEEIREAGERVVRSHHSFRTDWPRPLSTDAGMTPGLELLLGAVAHCAATTAVAKASLRGIEIEALDVTAEAAVDLRGVFEVDGAERPGLRSVRITLHLVADASDDDLRALVETVRATSPGIDTIANPVPLHLELERVEDAAAGASAEARTQQSA